MDVEGCNLHGISLCFEQLPQLSQENEAEFKNPPERKSRSAGSGQANERL